MKLTKISISLLLLLLLLIIFFSFGCTSGESINSFEECVAAGNPVMESYPRQCSANGRNFIEIVANDSLVDFEIKAQFPDKIVYENNNGLTIKMEIDCAERNGIFNECGSPCETENEACVEVCAYTCELPTFSQEEAYSLAVTGCSSGEVSSAAIYNNNTKTWWFDFIPQEPVPGCNPACVVFEETRSTEINWRCTGLIIED